MKLQTHYTLIILSLILAAVITLSAASLNRFNSSMAQVTEASAQLVEPALMQQTEERGRIMTRFLSENLSNPLYESNMEGIHDLLKAALQQNDVKHAVVFDSNGMILHDGHENIPSFGEMVEPQDLQAVKKVQGASLHRDGEELHVMAPIRLGEQMLGGVQISLSLAFLERESNAMRQRIEAMGEKSSERMVTVLVLIASLLALFGVGMAIWAARSLSRPIQHLTDHAKAMGRQDLSSPIVLKRRDELGDLAAALERMRGNLTASYDEIKRQNKELLELDGMKDDFLANITHEYKTPLNGILGLGVALREGSYGVLEGAVLKPVGQMVDSAERLLKLTHQILDFSKRADQQSPLALEEVALRGYLTRLMGRFEHQLQQQGVEGLIEADEGLSIWSEPDTLDNIFMNLLSNASKFTQYGHVRVVAEALDGPALAISVQDTGIGIPKAFQSKVFERFQQGFDSDSRGYEGSGLGLSILTKALERLGGAIQLKSRPGCGTVFTVLLPYRVDFNRDQLLALWQRHLQDEEPDYLRLELPDVQIDTLPETPFEGGEGACDQERALRPAQPLIDAMVANVLVVDDDAINREVVDANIRHEFNVLQADDGFQCLEMLERLEVDLILLDLMMPKLSGFEVLERMRQMDRMRRLPVIVLSAKNQLSSITRAFHLGSVDYITKPFQREELLARIRTHVQLRQVNRALNREKALIRNIIDSAHDFIISSDEHRVVQEFNPAAERGFGYRRDEIIGQTVLNLYAEHSDEQRVQQALLSEGVFTGEVTNRRKDGTTFPALLSAALLKDRHGRVMGAVGSGKDITEYKKMERVERERAIAVEASKAKSAFLASMSHEIRSPMSAVIGMTDLVLQTDLNDEQRQYLSIVLQSSESLLSLLNSILDFSKIEAKRLDLEVTDFDPLEVIERACETMSVPAHKKSLELLVDVAPEVPSVLMGDPTRLRQIIVNLVGNAVKFTQQGEVVVRAWMTDRDVDPTSGNPIVPPQNFMILRVSVTDTGIGIPEEKRASIFDSFSQADSSTTRKFGGTGLGLAISRQLVALMGGRMWVESGSSGKGSVFHFSALLEVKSCLENRMIFTQYTDYRDRRFLLVEENHTARGLLSHLLQLCGAEVETFSSGRAVAERLERDIEARWDASLISVQVSDFQSSGMGDLLLDVPQHFGRTILALPTGYRLQEHPRGHELGSCLRLMKPLRRYVLIHALNSALGHDVSAIAEDGRVKCAKKLRRMDPLNILLVDAERNSRKAAMRALVLDQHRVETAVTGPDALKAAARYRPDLILTGIQLPEIDGLTVASRIRSGAVSGVDPATPIIAVTAHVGMEAAAQEVEMNAFLAKPYKVDDLLDLVSQVMLQVKQSQRMAKLAQARKRIQSVPFTPPLGEEQPMMFEARRRFLETHQASLFRLESALEGEDLKRVESHATWIREHAQQIGADRVNKASFGLVMSARRGDLDKARENLAELQTQLQHVVDLVSAHQGV
ncbi:MAG: response regulator [Magnetococcales bacterium]|nr:response regulator [Magnetococcales bacterium]